MNAITRLAIPFAQSSVPAFITDPISTVAPTLISSNFDYLYVQLTCSAPAATTISFYGSMTNKNGSPAVEYCLVAGWLSTDVTRTLITSIAVGAAVPRLIIIPITFLYFYPLMTAYGGAGVVNCDVFAN